MATKDMMKGKREKVVEAGLFFKRATGWRFRGAEPKKGGSFGLCLGRGGVKKTGPR